MPSSRSRRGFLQVTLAGVAAAACSKSHAPPSSGSAGAPPSGSKPPEGPLAGAPNENDVQLPKDGAMPMRTLGATGVQVSLVGLGGYHIGVPQEAEGIRIIRTALDHGVNFLDNCWDYNDGESEKRVGKALKDGYRDKAFVMTKIDGRTKDAASKQIDQSLQRLGVDHVDLMQVHEVIRMNDPERVFGDDGAIAALLEAKKAGKIRFLGFTGHKDPAIHLHMIETADKHGFTFDTVQMPVNVMDPHYKSFVKEVIPVAQKKKMGILGMKPLGSGIILSSGAASAQECLRFAMSQPTSVVITGCDSMGVLKQALAVAYAFQPMPQGEMDALLARTGKIAENGKYERFKTSEQFDGTAKHPKWLESAEI